MQTISPYNAIDGTFYNSSGSLIPAGSIVMGDTSATGTTKMTIDPYATSRGPLEGQSDVPDLLFSITLGDAAASAGDRSMAGVALSDIPAGEWGVVRMWGPALVKCTESNSDNHLTSYGVSTTAGEVAEVTAAATLNTCCFQIGTSGSTTTGDKREVFVTCLGGQNALGGPLGAYV